MNGFNEGRNYDYKELFEIYKKFKFICGNINNDISFLLSLYAKEYLLRNHKLSEIDMAVKSQNANGFDIDIFDICGKRIIGEIKSTKSIKDNDFGAQQKKEIVKDLNKLRLSKAEIKYFFVSEENTYNILKIKYREMAEGITIVLLSDKKTDERKIEETMMKVKKADAVELWTQIISDIGKKEVIFETDFHRKKYTVFIENNNLIIDKAKNENNSIDIKSFRKISFKEFEEVYEKYEAILSGEIGIRSTIKSRNSSYILGIIKKYV